MRPRASKTKPLRKASASVVREEDVAISGSGLTNSDVGAAFAAAMNRFAPFERAPRLAVALSGGADSTALCLLARDWAVARGGRVTALTVDHGLRSTSAAEAQEVAEWTDRQRIEHHILHWSGEKPATRLQERARVARYRLLCEWCHGNGVLHLLLGHQADDQAETVLQRLTRGSGTDGLAGMSALVHREQVRLLRPLLACNALDLRHYLQRRGELWIEDPSNEDSRFARTRLRSLSPSLATAGLHRPVLLAAAERMAVARNAMHEAVVDLLARCCRLSPMGFARIDRTSMMRAPTEIGAKALARLVTTIGGSAHACNGVRARRQYQELFRNEAFVSRSLGRCLLSGRRSHVLICRELRDLPGPQVLRPGQDMLWDGRFRLRASGPESATRSLIVRPMLPDDWPILRRHVEKSEERLPPPLVRDTLPVLCDEGGMAYVPHLSYARDGSGQPTVVEAFWRPRNLLAMAGPFFAK